MSILEVALGPSSGHLKVAVIFSQSSVGGDYDKLFNASRELGYAGDEYGNEDLTITIDLFCKTWSS